ncbi:MAG: hypothetical protein IKU31_09225 [Oscillospiraceae bacterium]|nr:hypothetical protein [Oscillospiraceae bacterium]
MNNPVIWLAVAGAVLVGLLTSKHNDKNKGFTKFGRFIGSEKLLKDYDEENNFIDKHSR